MDEVEGTLRLVTLSISYSFGTIDEELKMREKIQTKDRNLNVRYNPRSSKSKITQRELDTSF